MKFARLSPPERVPLTIDLPGYLADHTVMGRAVLPATEAMQVLAAAAQDRFPGLDVMTLADIRFDRFLCLPPDGGGITAMAELGRRESGDVTAALITGIGPDPSDAAPADRHASFRIPGPGGKRGCAPMTPFDVEDDTPDMSIDPLHLYRDLVPLGPAFQSMVEPLHLWPGGALAVVSGRSWGLATLPGPLGSPFPLNAAFHGAGAWAQRYAGSVVFPVSMDRRYVFLPTRSGETYTAVVIPVDADGGRVVFDILIYDPCRRPSEFISRLVMRDLSRGRLRPPAWVAA